MLKMQNNMGELGKQTRVSQQVQKTILSRFAYKIKACLTYNKFGSMGENPPKNNISATPNRKPDAMVLLA